MKYLKNFIFICFFTLLISTNLWGMQGPLFRQADSECKILKIVDIGLASKQPIELGLRKENDFDILNSKFLLSEAADTDTTVRGNWTIEIRTLPTTANPKARILPHATRLELQCFDKTQRLVNRAYPIGRTFQWSQKNCGDVLFAIEIGNLVLSRRYEGSLAFVKFLRDFQNGQRTFYPSDFPDYAAALKRLGIKAIKVRYEMRGFQPLLNEFQKLNK
jgi:hypothetical protein